ncbi:hypothetical protein TIFTF001_000550 [Ficus carica]|uniref:BED-type domain-containing protein n=1 Tax=Ficus carica TaxID=3494 RepID=A0AA87ZGQ0_FICCA|nr:hypothetical protein TIFTF001_000550 [Ficus carica]
MESGTNLILEPKLAFSMGLLPLFDVQWNPFLNLAQPHTLSSSFKKTSLVSLFFRPRRLTLLSLSLSLAISGHREPAMISSQTLSSLLEGHIFAFVGFIDGLGLEVNLESGSVTAPANINVPIDEDGEKELEAISEDPTGKVKRKGRTTSIVWSRFDNFPLSEDKRLMAKCKECSYVYPVDSKNETRSLRRHMVVCQHKDT